MSGGQLIVMHIPDLAASAPSSQSGHTWNRATVGELEGLLCRRPPVETNSECSAVNDDCADRWRH